jgi:lambda repressor-like predicted transcriptional regulator
MALRDLIRWISNPAKKKQEELTTSLRNTVGQVQSSLSKAGSQIGSRLAEQYKPSNLIKIAVPPVAGIKAIKDIVYDSPTPEAPKGKLFGLKMVNSPGEAIKKTVVNYPKFVASQFSDIPATTTYLGSAVGQRQAGEDLGYFLRGAANQTPFGFMAQKLDTETYKKFEPTTQRQKTAQYLGTQAPGVGITLATGGAPLLAQGSLLNMGFNTAGNVIQGRPAFENTGKAALEGGSRGWQLLLTNTIADKVAGKFLPALTSKNMAATKSLLNNPMMKSGRKDLLLKTIKNNFQRSILETPIEASFYTTLDTLDPNRKEKFTEILSQNLIGSLMGNVAFAGLNSAFTTGSVLTKDQRKQFSDLFRKEANRAFDLLKREEGFVKIPEKKDPFPWENKEAKKKLKNLLGYENQLRHLGYSEDQTAKITYEEAQKIIKDQIPSELTKADVKQRVAEAAIKEHEQTNNFFKQLKYGFNEKLSPLKNASQPVQTAVKNWKKHIYSAGVQANEYGQKYKHIPDKDGWLIISEIQSPGSHPEIAKKYAKDIASIQADFKALRAEALEKGFDVKDLGASYIYQKWQGGQEAIARALGNKPGFSKKRLIPTYKVGMEEYGLKPEFTHPGALLASYKADLENKLANKQLFDSLVATKEMLPASKAPLDWEEIRAPLFPKAENKVGPGKIQIENYKAPKALATAINNIFGSDEGWKWPAKISSGWQNFKLGAGIPGTPVNAFAIAQTEKEIEAFHFGAIKTYLRAFSPKATEEYFEQRKDLIKDLADSGIRLRGGVDYKNLYENIFENKTFKSKLGKVYEEGWNKPTFDRLLPMYQLDLYEKSLKSGLTKEQAAGVLKNFYGIIDDLDSGRSKTNQNILTTLFMAPRYREGIVGFWKANLQSIFIPKNWNNPTFNENRKYLAGLATVYVLTNLLNKKISGRWCWQNKPGNEFSLEVPTGGGRSIFIPIGSSILTMPRRAIGMANATLHGDIPEAFKQASGFASFPIQTATELATNKTFYGGEIVNQDDSAGQKIWKSGKYLLEEAIPYGGDVIAWAEGRKNLPEALMGMAELPIRPGQSSDKFILQNKRAGIQRDLTKGNLTDFVGALEDGTINKDQAKTMLKAAFVEAFKRGDDETAKKLARIAQSAGMKPQTLKNAVTKKKLNQVQRAELIKTAARILRTSSDEKAKELIGQIQDTTDITGQEIYQEYLRQRK